MRTPWMCTAWWILTASLVAGCGGGGDGGGEGGEELPALLLQEPAAAAELTAQPARFCWTSLGAGTTYRLVLVEFTSNQIPAQVHAGNPVHFQTELTGECFTVGDSGLTLEEGKGYAWGVTGRNARGERSSAVGWLRMRWGGETVSRADAISTLLHRYVVPATLGRTVTAYLDRLPLPGASEVWPWDEEQNTETMTDPTWFGWIDDQSNAFFAHATRYVFIDARTGTVVVKPFEWWPVLDEESLWMNDAARRDRETIVYSSRHLE